MRLLLPTFHVSGPRCRQITAATLLFTIALCSGCRKAAVARADAATRDPHCYQVESELRDSSAEQTSLAMAIQAETRATDEIDARASTDRQALAELQTATRGYMQEHNIAVAALLAGPAGAEILVDSATSDDAKRVAASVEFIALIWAATHQDELHAVEQALQASRDRRASLQQDVEQAQAEGAAKLRHIDDLKLRESKAEQKAGLLRSALCAAATPQAE